MHASRSPRMAFAVNAMIGNFPDVMIGTIAPNRLVSVHLGHHDVHQDDVDVVARTKQVDTVDSALRRDGLHSVGA